MNEGLWNTHDFKVRMLDWSATRGSRLGHTCRRCGRGFSRFPVLSYGVWAIDDQGRALESAVTDLWLSQPCPRAVKESDKRDRKRLRETPKK